MATGMLDEVTRRARTVYLQGPYGTGKTELAVQHIYRLLADGVSPERIVVIVPQRTLGRPYQLAMRDVERGPLGHVSVRTVGGIARDMVSLWWPAVAQQAGFVQPDWEPTYLSVETAQYYMERFVRPAQRDGKFDSINVPPNRLISQILDNLNKAALMGIPHTEVASRLRAAWGDRPSSRLLVFTTTQEVASAFRQHCLDNSLLDFSLQVEIFTQHLLPDPAFRESFFGAFSHLIADNVEEDTPVTHDIIRDWLPTLDSALLVSDTEAGFRVFLGADPGGAAALGAMCDETVTLTDAPATTPALVRLADEISGAFTADSPPVPEDSSGDVDIHDAFEFRFHNYYPQMLDWVAGQIAGLVEDGVAPGDIVVLAPFLSDALRFSLMHKLEQLGIDSVSHRPSRALRDEPAARAMLALAAIAHPQWDLLPPDADMVDALGQAIGGLDPVRAQLLAKVIYRRKKAADFALTPFENVKAEMQARITYTLGERYEGLRTWLADYRTSEPAPLDHFFSRLFGEVLSQPGYGFHTRQEAGRIVAQLIESARRFRQVLYVGADPDLDRVGTDYLTIVNQGLLAALHVPSWRDEARDAVFMAPAYTYLMRNRVADYHFWLDVGSNGWWERLDQPITHPYVLSRSWQADRMWTDGDEYTAQQAMLHRIAVGLVRRCRKKIFLGISDLGEQGFEQRGPMLRIFQQILRRHPLQGQESES